MSNPITHESKGLSLSGLIDTLKTVKGIRIIYVEMPNGPILRINQSEALYFAEWIQEEDESQVQRGLKCGWTFNLPFDPDKDGYISGLTFLQS
jgi:hypothetical protein